MDQTLFQGVLGYHIFTDRQIVNNSCVGNTVCDRDGCSPGNYRIQIGTGYSKGICSVNQVLVSCVYRITIYRNLLRDLQVAKLFVCELCIHI